MNRTTPPHQPSRLYQSVAWASAVRASACLPSSCAGLLVRSLCRAYAACARHRFDLVRQNLLPVFNHDSSLATRAAHRLFSNFGQKLVDLWRFEAGTPAGSMFHHWEHWDRIASVLDRKQGILFVTLHIGNWELGAPLLKQRGVDLQVVTLAEPHPALTRFRQRARQQHGIHTQVISPTDPFAFIPIIQHLQKGGAVALLIDRPAPTNRLTVTLFNRPFHLSVAPVELARATGCTILPVLIPRRPGGYSAWVHSEIGYDRAELRHPPHRQELSQRIIAAFEPSLRQYSDQWYHFVPIWPHLTTNPPS